jgi:hypothetical protein
MRKVIIFTLSAILTVAAADAYLGQIVFSFPITSTPRGLGVGPEYLYHLGRGSTRCVVIIYRADTGSRHNMWEAPILRELYGCAYTEGGYLWLSGSWYQVYQCNASTGSLYGSWECGPDGLAPFCTDDYGKGATALYASGMNAYTISKFDLTTHSLISSFQNPYQAPQDLAYDWRNQLVWASYELGTIWACTTTGSFVTALPIGSGRRGLAYSAEYLWVTSRNMCYKIHCPYDFLSMTPASLGRVKTLYR